MCKRLYGVADFLQANVVTHAKAIYTIGNNELPLTVK